MGHLHGPDPAPPAGRPHHRAGVPGRLTRPTSGQRAPPAADICPVTGRGRLSYPRAEYLFKTASAKLDPHRQGWTSHQLRHSALQHLAQAGRTAPELQATSRHQHLASLGRYVRLGEETSARITAEADPAQRRQTR
ncbi:tyrosine-type recombinase/integrase [Nonomuraea sp. NPDC050394]|uniref:tyrosine-type recombinase/integrase n=1 Tax=Nonomuraea sp. NPDC050394 TaxID=3364363 RepID=UPI0037A29C6C